MSLLLTKPFHGTVAGDGTGNTAFIAFQKINTTFDAIKVDVDLNTTHAADSDIHLASSTFLKHSLATAANDWLVASGAGAFVKKTLAQAAAIMLTSSAFATFAQGESADTAFGWGNHASGGYAASSHVHSSLAASDGDPAVALSMDADGNATFTGFISIFQSAALSKLNVYGDVNHQMQVYQDPVSGAQQGGIGMGGTVSRSSGGTLTGIKTFAGFQSFNMLMNNQLNVGFQWIKHEAGATTTDGALTQLAVLDPSGNLTTLGGLQTKGISDLAVAKALYIDNAGNVGIKSTLKVWRADSDILQLGATASLVSKADIATYLVENGYIDAGNDWVYIATRAAAYMDISSGRYRFNTAPSGTAGADITFTNRLTIENNGNLVVETGNLIVGAGSIEIGTPPIAAHVNADNLVVSGTGDVGLTILSGSTSDCSIFFGHSADNNNGRIRYDQNIDTMDFVVGDAVAITIDVLKNSTFAGLISVDDTTDSSSTASGSIHTDGGLGVVKQIRVGTSGAFGTFITAGSFIRAAYANAAIQVQPAADSQFGGFYFLDAAGANSASIISSADTDIMAFAVSGAEALRLTASGITIAGGINVPSIPTTNQLAGTLWSNSGNIEMGTL